MKLQLPDGTFRAYLFDCDGTIVDSMPLHYVAWRRALAEWNCHEFREDLFYAWGGMPVDVIIAKLNQEHRLKMPAADVAKRREELFFEMLPHLRVVPEVLEHLEGKYGAIPLAVVSGSTRQCVMASLEALELLNRFDVLVCAGDYPRSKPEPDAFLVAASMLGIAPESCLVFEDTDIGIRAAAAAGMACVKVPPPWERTGTASTKAHEMGRIR
jgi:HAD superfamily hydrolase (TIGR01509 family)